MSLIQLLDALKDPANTLSVGEKLIAGLSVALISMVVVYIILMLISGIITLLQKGANKPEKVSEVSVENTEVSTENSADDVSGIEELVAVITAAISAQSGTSASNIIVKKVIRSNNNKSSWENMKRMSIR